jgi:7-cyano-7-deazaguanine synthase
MQKAKAVLLLSGGLDSATVLKLAEQEGFEVYALSFDYGQRHEFELECVEKIKKHHTIAHHQRVTIDLRTFGKSSLTSEMQVPKGQYDPTAPSDVIPNTYVPARNTIFLSYALAYAEVIGSQDIFMGAHSLDYSNYPDCRPEYLECFEKLANLATVSGVQGKKIRIHAPLLYLTKSEIIRKGLSLGVDYSLTSSCYHPIDGKACGQCDSCTIRLQGFRDNDMADPIAYQ